MTVSTTAILTIRRSERKRGYRLFRSPTAVLALIWLIGLVVASLTSPLWLRYGPLEQDLTAVLQGPPPRTSSAPTSSVATCCPAS